VFYRNLISIVRSVNRRISGVEFLFVLLSQLESPLSMRSKSEKVKRNFENNFKKFSLLGKSARNPPFFLKKFFHFFIYAPLKNDSD